MKKLRVMLVGAFAVLAMLTLSACVDSTADTLEHECIWSDWTVTTHATCTAAAVETRVCQEISIHRETRESVVELPVGHFAPADNDWTVTVPATCTTAGIKVRQCLRDNCLYEFGSETISKTGHNIQEVGHVSATCTESGALHLACTNSGCTQTGVAPISALGHPASGNWDVIVPATCTTAGYKAKVCLRDGCTHEIEREEIEIDPDAHYWTYNSWRYDPAPTCYTEGERTRTKTCMHNSEHNVLEAETLPAQHKSDEKKTFFLMANPAQDKYMQDCDCNDGIVPIESSKLYAAIETANEGDTFVILRDEEDMLSFIQACLRQGLALQAEGDSEWSVVAA